MSVCVFVDHMCDTLDPPVRVSFLIDVARERSLSLMAQGTGRYIISYMAHGTSNEKTQDCKIQYKISISSGTVFPTWRTIP